MSRIDQFGAWDCQYDWTLDVKSLYDVGTWPFSCASKPPAVSLHAPEPAPPPQLSLALAPPPQQQQQIQQGASSSEFTSWTGKHPLHWSRDEVLDWLFFVGVQAEHGVDFARYPTEAFNAATGADLARMSEGEFVQKMGPDYGSLLYGLFWSAMRQQSCWQPLEQQMPPPPPQQEAGARCFGVAPAPFPPLEAAATTNAPTTTTPTSAAAPWTAGSRCYETDPYALAFAPGCRTRSLCFYDDDEDDDPFARPFVPPRAQPPPATLSSFVVAPPSPLPDDRLGDRQSSTESDDTAVLSRSDSGAEPPSSDSPDDYDEDDESDATPGCSGGLAGDIGGASAAARDADAKSGAAKSKLLWEFVRDLLKDPLYNPRCIKWEDKAEGVFRFVQSDVVAKMWGRIKNNDNMTYEKLSRAMRYYYKRGILERVDGKRLVYKFSAGARGWS